MNITATSTHSTLVADHLEQELTQEEQKELDDQGLYEGLVDACEKYGRITSHAYALIDRLMESLEYQE